MKSPHFCCIHHQASYIHGRKLRSQLKQQENSRTRYVLRLFFLAAFVIFKARSVRERKREREVWSGTVKAFYCSTAKHLILLSLCRRQQKLDFYVFRQAVEKKKRKHSASLQACFWKHCKSLQSPPPDRDISTVKRAFYHLRQLGMYKKALLRKAPHECLGLENPNSIFAHPVLNKTPDLGRQRPRKGR